MTYFCKRLARDGFLAADKLIWFGNRVLYSSVGAAGSKLTGLRIA